MVGLRRLELPTSRLSGVCSNQLSYKPLDIKYKIYYTMKSILFHQQNKDKFHLMANYYEWFKAIHIISVISWMVGLLYLPRLFVYHCSAKHGSDLYKTLCTMERKLLFWIMTPAMLLSLVFGLINAYYYGFLALGIWFHIKFLLVMILILVHCLCFAWAKRFANGNNQKSAKFFKIVNEIPTICMIIIVIMVVIKPFE